MDQLTLIQATGAVSCYLNHSAQVTTGLRFRMEKPDHTGKMLLRLAVLFVISVLLNFPWEVAQMPLYVEGGNWFEFALHCIIPSLGDGLLVMLIFGVGRAVLGQSVWTDQPGWASYALMLMTGFSVALIVEWVGFYGLNRWSYTASMPLLPGLGIGVAPVLQMLILPPLIFRITGWWLARMQWA